MFPAGRSVTLVHRVLDGLDGFGNDTYRDEPVTVANCVVAPGGSYEETQWTDQVNTDITVYFPYGTPIGPLDAIRIDGREYEVRGDPSSWVSPFSGRTAPVEVHARVVTGASA